MALRRIALARADGTVVCGSCRVARSFVTRLRGLMGSSSLPIGSGILFRRTRSVHTHFMRFPIDVVFLDGENRIVSIVDRLRPWRGAASRRARSVLELAAGECKRLGLCEGETLLETRA
jgi:uncharacterized membrane protein (UPF0127 family)